MTRPELEPGSKNAGERKRSIASRLADPILKRDSLVFVLFAALTIVLTNPLVLHLANAVEDKQDGLLNVWIIAWVGHALITDPLNLFNANIFYPYPNTLAYSETMLPQGLFALPFNLAFDNTILGYNLVLLGSFFLAAYAMYLFMFDLTRNRGAAVVAGVIFAFNPYNLGNLAQVQLLSFGWLPLAVMYLRRIMRQSTVDGQQSTVLKLQMTNREWRSVFLFSLFFSLQALSSFYYAFLAGFAVALYILWYFIVHRPRLSAIVRVLISGILIAIAVVPFFLPYLSVQREMGFERKVAESEPFSASLKLYTEVSPQNVLYGNVLAPRPPAMVGGYPLDHLFPGVLAVVLGSIGIIASKNRERWFFVVLLFFSFLLSLGPRLFLAPAIGTEITLPYRWLYDVFPLMKALRAPVRFDALVMFALAVLAGWGMFRVAGGEWQIAKSFIFHPSSFILPLVALEYLAFPAANIAPVPVWNEIPEYVRWLAKQPPGVVLELPTIASDPAKPLDLTTQYLSTYHWHTTPDGYSGFNPPRRGEVAYEMQFFPSERAISLLNTLDTRHVVLHDARIPADNLQLAQQFGNTRVYRIAPRARDVAPLHAQLYLPNPAAPNQNYLAYIVITNRTASSFAIKPTSVLHIEARWSRSTIQRTTVTMPLVTSRVSVVPVKLLAPPNLGTQRLDLRVTSDATGIWSLSGEVTLAESEPAYHVVLPARVELRAPLKFFYTPGDPLEIALTWQPLNKIDAYYSASVRVVDEHGNKVTNDDREPASKTMLWMPEVPVPDRYTLDLPRDLASGTYSVQVKMYQADQGIDALLLDENNVPQETSTLGKFTVK